MLYEVITYRSAHFTAFLYYPCKVSKYTQDPAGTVHLIAELREEHRDLDEAIARLSEDPSVDQLRLTRLKKRKLKLVITSYSIHYTKLYETCCAITVRRKSAANSCCASTRRVMSKCYTPWRRKAGMSGSIRTR